mgnify:CR=1 FL=1
MGLIITLIVIGIILLVAELVLLPGISVAGIAAFVSFAAAIFYGFFHFGVVGGSIIVASIVILSIIAVVVSLRANTWRRLSLKTTIEGSSTPTPEQQNIRIGQQGETITRLAPMGKVRFGEVTIEAKSIDSFLDPHQTVEVIGYDNILRRFGLGLRMTTVEQSVVDLAAAGWGMLGSRIDAVVRGDGDSGAGRPWLASPQVKVLTPKLVQAACA